MRTGIYQIRHLESGKRYIGSAARSLASRWVDHQRLLRSDCHHSVKLQHAWNKHGADSFVFEILLYCNPEDCLTFEQMAIDCYKSEYNICLVAGSSLGRKHSKDTKAKMKAAHSGVRHYNYGGSISEEHKIKISISMSGRRNPWFGKTRHTHSRVMSGAGNPRAILSPLDIVAIKELLTKGLTQRAIAKQFGVSQTCISDIKRGKTW